MCLCCIPQEVFSKEHSSNTALTWLLRGVGFLLVAIGFNLIMRIIVTLCKLIGQLNG